VDSTLSGNEAGSYGGGLFNFDQGFTTLDRSTLSNNIAGFGGGAIYIGNDAVSTVTLTNSTLANNTTAGSGGAIRNYLGNIHISHSTISGNSAPANQTGGVLNAGGNSASVENSIIAGNMDSGISPDVWSNVTIDTFGVNLIGDNTGASGSFQAGLFVGTALDSVEPMLGSLADNGGGTQTMLPLYGSLAINNGVDTSVEPGRGSSEDQRGQYRPQGGEFDIGAVELVDTDKDGIIDVIEVANGLDPNNLDSDGDGLVDGSGGYTSASAYPGGVDDNGDGWADGEQDYGTDPNSGDSDGDGASDVAEVTDVYGSDSAALDPTVYRGDGNANETGAVEAGDVLLCTQVVIGAKIQTPQYEFHCDAAPADAQGVPQPDGVIGVGDVIKVQQKALGVTSP
jgi:hypothetical protein